MGGNNSSILSSYGSSSTASSSSGLMGDAIGSIPETIKIEHTLTFTFNIADRVWVNLHRFLSGGTARDGSNSNSKAVRQTVKQIVDLAKDYSESFRFISIGIGSYFFLLGCAKVLEAGGGNNVGSSSSKKSSSSSSKKMSSSSSHKQDERPPSNDPTDMSKKSKSSSRRRRSTESSTPSTTVVSLLEEPQTLHTDTPITNPSIGGENSSLSRVDEAPVSISTHGINTETVPEMLEEFRNQTTDPEDENKIDAA